MGGLEVAEFASGGAPMRILRENSVTLALLGLFALSILGQALAEWRSYDQERALHHEAAVTLRSYLMTGDFISTVFENWGSEFLQMGALAVLTVFLRQKGSPEYKTLGEPEPEDEWPGARRNDSETPWPVRRGGVVLWLYSHSLSTALFLLFALSFALHAVGSAWKASEEAARHGSGPVGLVEHLGSAEFWFESFQNWQSEFLSVAILAVLGIYLRERGSPGSKPVAAPHSATGR
jgi:hypothetical protein